jgi:hypothetical protein
MQRLPKASCGVLPVSVFRDARVNYVMRRLGEATDEFFEALMAKLETVMPEASEAERRAAMLEGLARTVPGWSAPVVNQRMQRLLELARDFEANMHAAFAIYVKDTYAEDLRGRRRKVQVCMPKLSAFLHMYFCRIVIAPEVKRGSYFDRTSTTARNFAVCNAMLDALAEVCVENVRVIDVPGHEGGAAAASSGPPRPRTHRSAAHPPASVASVGGDHDGGGGGGGGGHGGADDFDDASSFASVAHSEASSMTGGGGGLEHTSAHRPSQPHPFDAIMKTAQPAKDPSRFHTFVPPVTAGVPGAGAGAAGAGAGAAAPPVAAAGAPPPPGAALPKPRDSTDTEDDGSSGGDNMSVPSISSDGDTESTAQPPPPSSRKHSRKHSRAVSRKTTASSTAGAMALLRKLKGGS